MPANTAVQSPADLANNALTRMGYKLRVGSLYDGSFAAKKILDVYAQTRDELLRSWDWGFARRDVAMTMLKSAPVGGYIPPAVWNPATNPALPWKYSFTYPGDCLKVRAVKRQSLFVPNYNPFPELFAVENDAGSNPPQRVILCNFNPAILTYTGQITDPNTWDVGFVESFSATLGRHLGPALANLETQKAEGADEGQATAMAEAEQG